MPGSSLGRHLESGVDPGNEVAVVMYGYSTVVMRHVGKHLDIIC